MIWYLTPLSELNSFWHSRQRYFPTEWSPWKAGSSLLYPAAISRGPSGRACRAPTTQTRTLWKARGILSRKRVPILCPAKGPQKLPGHQQLKDLVGKCVRGPKIPHARIGRILEAFNSKGQPIAMQFGPSAAKQWRLLPLRQIQREEMGTFQASVQRHAPLQSSFGRAANAQCTHGEAVKLQLN